MHTVIRCLGAALLLSLAGCMPSYHVMLKPSAAATRWENGKQMLLATADSVEALMGVASVSERWVEFDVTVRNRSRRPVLVAPEEFFVLADYPATKNTAATQARIGAENPELALQSLQQQADFHTRKSTAVPLTEILSTVSSVADDLTSTKRKETTEQYNARQAAYNSEMARYEQNRTSHAVQANTLRDDVRQLEDTRLRKTTLDPGFALQGRVRFPAWYHAATHLRLVLPVSGRELAGEFTQTAYRMDGTQPPTSQPAQFRVLTSQTVPPAPATVRP